MTARRFTPPWSVEELDVCFVVRTIKPPCNGEALPRSLCRPYSCSRTSGRRKEGTAFSFLVEASILPDLHRIAASRARIAVAGDDDALLSISPALQFARNNASHHPSYLKKDERPHGASARKTKQSENQKSEFGRHVAVGWHVAVDFEPDADFNQDRCGPRHAFLL